MNFLHQKMIQSAFFYFISVNQCFPFISQYRISIKTHSLSFHLNISEIEMNHFMHSFPDWKKIAGPDVLCFNSKSKTKIFSIAF